MERLMRVSGILLRAGVLGQARCTGHAAGQPSPPLQKSWNSDFHREPARPRQRPPQTVAAPWLCPGCAPAVPQLDTGRTPAVPRLYPVCTLSVPCLYPRQNPGWSPAVPCLYPVCTPSVPWPELRIFQDSRIFGKPDFGSPNILELFCIFFRFSHKDLKINGILQKQQGNKGESCF